MQAIYLMPRKSLGGRSPPQESLTLRKMKCRRRSGIRHSLEVTARQRSDV